MVVWLVLVLGVSLSLTLSRRHLVANGMDRGIPRTGSWIGTNMRVYFGAKVERAERMLCRLG